MFKKLLHTWFTQQSLNSNRNNMKRIFLYAALFLTLCDSTFSFAAQSTQSVSSRTVEINTSVSNFPAELRRLIADAKNQHLTPFVQITAEWCGPCKRMTAAMSDPLMQDAVQGAYLIRVDIDAWHGELQRANMPVKGVPAIFALDSTGKPTGKMLTGSAWGEDIPENIAPPLKKFIDENRWH
jgi:thiol:disulfide interchange protein